MLTQEEPQKPSPYEALGPDKEIRHLLIQPSTDFHADINATLETISLSDPDRPSYAALSYVWGPTSSPLNAVINGVEWKVPGQNLDTALRYLRKKDEIIRIWIDAVCINQTNEKEKEYQVGMMADIYRSAEMVIVWLGKESEDSDLAMDTCEAWGNDMLTWERGQGRHPEVFNKQDEYRRAEWIAIKNLMQRAYWTRLWIYQEVQLSRKAIVKCGEKEIDWECFRGLYNGSKFIYGKKTILRTALRYSERRRVNDSGIGALDLFFDFDKIKSNDEAFFRILRRTAMQDCTVAKDRMYAIRGLAKDGEEYPKLAYDKKVSTARVYAEHMKKHIESTGSLECLNEASCRLYKKIKLNGEDEQSTKDNQDSKTELDAKPEEKRKLPSWVPNWVQQPQRNIVLENCDGLVPWYNASSSFSVFNNDTTIKKTLKAVEDYEKMKSIGPGTGTESASADGLFEDANLGFEDTQGFDPLAMDYIIQPYGVKCDTITKVARKTVLNMDYQEIIDFIGRGYDGSHPTGRPLFNVLYRTSLMGIYPIKSGFGPLRDHQFTGELAEGFLLQVAIDLGYLREIHANESGRTVDLGTGDIPIASYGWVRPFFEVDFKFLDLDVEKAAMGHPDFATFQSFVKGSRENLGKQLGDWFLISQFRQSVRDATEGRTLFVTRYGFVGLATNPNIEEGDIVTVLCGGQTPFILRQHEESKTSARLEHELVSDAYVDGLMEGEAFKCHDGWMRDHRNEPALRQFTIV